LTALWKVVAGLVASYRPEKHYMRGPGPKCSRKKDCARRVKEDA
jgi:hypothetical protein